MLAFHPRPSERQPHQSIMSLKAVAIQKSMANEWSGSNMIHFVFRRGTGTSTLLIRGNRCTCTALMTSRCLRRWDFIASKERISRNMSRSTSTYFLKLNLIQRMCFKQELSWILTPTATLSAGKVPVQKFRRSKDLSIASLF